MTFKDINIRDPFVLPYEGKYYLYGTRGETAWTKAYGLEVYVSDDLKTWSDPHECFYVPKNAKMHFFLWCLPAPYYLSFSKLESIRLNCAARELLPVCGPK